MYPANGCFFCVLSSVYRVQDVHLKQYEASRPTHHRTVPSSTGALTFFSSTGKNHRRTEGMANEAHVTAAEMKPATMLITTSLR